MVRIPEQRYTRREQTVVNFLQHIEIGSFLNVGFRKWKNPKNHWWRNICEANNIYWKIAESWEPNVISSIKNGCPTNRILHINIKDVNDLPESDCLMFWHGPEHLKKEEMLGLLPELEKKYPVLIFGMPLGEALQGEAHGNPYEKHLSEWQSEDWCSLGYMTKEIHDNAATKAHLTAIKVKL